MGIEGIEHLKPGDPEPRLSISQKLTQRAEELRTAEELADAVDNWKQNPTTTNDENMSVALAAYREVRSGGS